MGHGFLWQRAIFWLYGAMDEKGWEYESSITQHARIHTTRIAFTNRRHSLVGSVLGFCVTSQCALSIKVQIPPKSHFN